MSDIGIIAWDVAFGALRLPTAAVKQAWGGSGAKGVTRRAIPGFDEDPTTLGVAAGRRVLAATGAQPAALFVGATTLPYEEKPSSAAILSGVTSRRDLRVVELRGSPQAGLQALAAAHDFCAANPGTTALAIATDAPEAHPSVSASHGLGAGAAAFLVGGADVKARITLIAGVSLDTFGSRFRRKGQIYRDDLELRSDEDADGLAALTPTLAGPWPTLAFGGDPALEKKALAAAGAGVAVSLRADTGDLGAATGPVALAAALDGLEVGERVLALALGSGGFAVGCEGVAAGSGVGVAARAAAGREIDYLEFLKQTGFLARPERGA
jgi:hydroxymethylglutaryl-CoA synthase